MTVRTPLVRRVTAFALAAGFALLGASGTSGSSQIDSANGPTVVDGNLEVRTVVGGLVQPISLAFLGANDLLVLEKSTGKVQRVVGGAVQSTVLDLSVNFASERGLLGITLDPDFAHNHYVYLYWSCRSSAPPSNPFFPDERQCLDTNMSGPDTDDILQVPLLGNRVDRFLWNGSTLTHDRNLIMLRSFQNDGGELPPGQGDSAQPPRGNHDGGVIDFGPDGKLYILLGDVGRRGQLQNLRDGPTAPGVADDQFGGPDPDDAHLTGVILRLNADGSTPGDNPFSSSANPNVRKVFAYGLRNSFGMDFDPVSGALWDEQNGDDSFTELNRVDRGQNGGWVQIMGPVERIAQFKAIETSPATDPVTGTPYFGLQQLRWSPTNIASTPAEALSRLFMLPGSHYSDPEFSWKFEVAPGGIGFLNSRALGPQYQNDLFVGAARTFLEDGFLWHFNLTGNRRKIAVDDPRLGDRVADNNTKFDITESESLLFGRGFGIGTDVETGPNGNLFVVSLSNGAVYEIRRKR
jgi:glucose/arabinose dehydrogenase